MDFHILSVINNGVTIIKDNISVEVTKGRTCFIPAGFGSYSILPHNNKEAIIIKTTA